LARRVRAGELGQHKQQGGLVDERCATDDRPSATMEYQPSAVPIDRPAGSRSVATELRSMPSSLPLRELIPSLCEARPEGRPTAIIARSCRPLAVRPVSASSGVTERGDGDRCPCRPGMIRFATTG
jgi:hypothetical protein